MYLQQHSQVIKNLDRRLHEQQSHHKSTEDVQAVTRQPYETQRRIVDLAENEYVTQMHQNVDNSDVTSLAAQRYHADLRR